MAKDIQSLRTRIRKKLKEVEPSTIQRLMEGVVKRIDTVRRWSVIENSNKKI